MGTIISIVSGKGGVGKTTLTANLAFALALQEHTVIAVDGDMGLRNLDILLGLESKAVYDLADVLEGRCTVGNGIVAHDVLPSLHFIPGSTDYNLRVDRRALRRLCRFLADHYEYVLIDAPAGVGEGFRNTVYCADRCIVVATPEFTSLRDAARTAEIVSEQRAMRTELIINKVNKQMIKKGYLQNVDEVMDAVSLPLLGLVPFSNAVVIRSNRGQPLSGKNTPADTAFQNIALRISGDDVPLAGYWRK